MVGPRVMSPGRDLDAEGLERLDDHALGGEQFVAVGFRRVLVFIGIEQVEARQFVVLEAA